MFFAVMPQVKFYCHFQKFTDDLNILILNQIFSSENIKNSLTEKLSESRLRLKGKIMLTAI